MGMPYEVVARQKGHNVRIVLLWCLYITFLFYHSILGEGLLTKKLFGVFVSLSSNR